MSRATATRIPEDFAPSPALMQYARDQGVANVDRMLEDFRDFWSAKSGKDATKMDWAATWRLWARKEGDKAKEAAAREQRYQQRFAAPTGLLTNSQRKGMERGRFKEEEKSPEVPLTPEQREFAAAALKRMGIHRSMQ
ncbi:hypothetical protein [Aureimonas glaciei]|uniref:Uncharacterized protein n=1 Tax=Aureimonas glaciei TaxID=1776957 RepID=A0A916Y4H9_9HYPH|nr:hypothetical protein [Aureimonas glaciei]GGD30939.1 hypothetical protein GCM10011335_37480 [Aureimonas glaciei]